MHKKATRINRAILCAPSNKWFDTEMIDEHAFVFQKASQASAIISEMYRNNLLYRRAHPTNPRGYEYKKSRGANEYLKRRISKAKPATTPELIREFEANIDILGGKS